MQSIVDIEKLSSDSQNYGSYDKHRLELLAEQYGVTYLGSGSFRHAFELPNGHVLKVEHGGHGSTDAEVNTWTRLTPEVRQYLVPLIEHGSNWVIQGKAEPIADYHKYLITWVADAFPGMEAYFQQIQDVKCHLLGNGISDMHEFNFGVHDGKVKLFDYGC